MKGWKERHTGMEYSLPTVLEVMEVKCSTIRWTAM